MSPISRTLAALFVLAIAAAACDGGGDEAAFVTYERAWPDGFTETTEVYEDGRVRMFHGENLERITISSADVGAIRAALELPIEADADGASPVRTLRLGDGTVIEAPRPDPGGAIDLLDRLTSTHSIDDEVTDIEPIEAHASHAHDEGT